MLRMNGHKLGSLGEFRLRFDFESARDYLRQGRLSAWFREIGENAVADELDELKDGDYCNQTLLDNFVRIFNLPPEVGRQIRGRKSSAVTVSETISSSSEQTSSVLEKIEILPELSEAQVNSIRDKIAEILEDTSDTLLSEYFRPIHELVGNVYKQSMTPFETKQMERLSFVIHLFREEKKQNNYYENYKEHFDKIVVNTLLTAAKYTGSGKNVDKLRPYSVSADSHLKTDLGFTQEEQEIRFRKIRSRYHVKLDDLSLDPTIEEVCLAVESDLYGRNAENRTPVSLPDNIQEEIKAELSKQNNSVRSVFSGSDGRPARLFSVISLVDEKLHHSLTPLLGFSERIDLHRQLKSGYGLLEGQLNEILEYIRKRYDVELLFLPADPTTEEIVLALETELAQ